MSPAFAATIVIGGSSLLTYAVIERRLNQRSCPECGLRASSDAFSNSCPGCGRKAPYHDLNWRRRNVDAGRVGNSETKTLSKMKDGLLRSPGNAEAGYGLGGRRWALSVLILIPFLIAATDTAILVGRQEEPVTEKAIRLVKESSSPIESFSIQQYLNGTLYHRRDRGAKIQIRGWTAVQDSKSKGQTEVEFAYSEDGADRVARWIVDVPARDVIPANQEAVALSWMK